MNCDTCIYRSAMPGFAERVGQLQTPHHHPDDAGHEHGGHSHERDLLHA
jgi:sirohydrochlorin cobaltochelatase